MSTGTTSLLRSILAKILLGFLILTFAVWGVGDMLRGTNTRIVAEVGDATISLSQFQQNLQQFQQQVGQNLPPEMLNSPMLQQQVISQLVQQTLVDETAKASGLHITRAMVAAEIRANPMLQDLRGNFDASAFTAMLQNMRTSEAEFIRRAEIEMRSNMLLDSWAIDQLKAPFALQELAAQTASELRDITLITLPVSAYKEKEAPSEESLKMLYERIKLEAYATPESRNVRFARITTEQLNARVESRLTEEEVRNYYEKNNAAFTGKSFADARLRAKEKLRAQVQEDLNAELQATIDDAAAAGDSLEKVLKTAGLDVPTESTVLVKGEALPRALDGTGDTAFALEQNAVSGLLSTRNGLVILSVENIAPTGAKPFADVRADVLSRYRENRTEQWLDDQIIVIKQQLADAKTLESKTALLKKLPVRSQFIKRIMRSGDDQQKLPAMLHGGIFNANVGEVAGPAVTEKGERLLAIVHEIHVANTAPEMISDAIRKNANGLVQSLVGGDLLRDAQAQFPVTLYPPENSQAQANP